MPEDSQKVESRLLFEIPEIEAQVAVRKQRRHRKRRRCEQFVNP